MSVVAMRRDEQEPQRETPAAIESEQALIGAVLVNNEAFHAVSNILKLDHFYEPIHRNLWKVISDQIGTGRAATPVTIRPFIPADEKIGDTNLMGYVVSLMNNAVNVVNARDFAYGVIDMAERRQLVIIGEEMVAAAFNAAPDVPGFEIAADYESKLADLRSESPKEEGPGTAKAAVQRLMERHSRNERAPSISLPLQQIHEVANGDLEAGNLYGLLSSSGEGKTSLVLQIIDHAASNGHPVLFLSYDQSADQCVEQMASQRLGIDSTRIRERTLSEREYERFYAELHKISQLPWVTQRCTREGTAQLASHVRRFMKKVGDKVPLVVLDHVRKVTPRDPKAHEGRIASEINGFCKAMAGEVGCVWLNLNQRNSAGMKRDNPRPISSDMFGGEQAKEDYDAILYLYRPEKYQEDQIRIAKNDKEKDDIMRRFEGWQGQAEIGALKVRFGDPTIRRRLRFEKECTRYISMRDEAPPAFEGMGF